MRRLLFVLLLPSLALAQNPKAWTFFAPHPETHNGLLDQAMAHSGHNSAGLHSTERVTPGSYGLYVQDIDAEKFRGSRVRLSGYLRTTGVTGWAGMWIRVDGRKGPPLAFNNMQDRPISKTTPWTLYQIELTVPPQAETIHYGFLLTGAGQAWMDDLQLEALSAALPGQSERQRLRKLPLSPTNLGFEE